jgi:uncharacterized delta-60 repeat protein
MIPQFQGSVRRAALVAMVISLVGSTVALAASGGLDTTFSGDGRQHTDFAGGLADYLIGMALQTDGRIVAVGVRYDPAHFSTTSSNNFEVVRYKTNGALDPTFSGDGKVLTDFGGKDKAEDVAIQSDGKIVVAGNKCSVAGPCDLAVARYNSNGLLDTTFSGDGKQVIPFGSGDNGTFGGLAIQGDGKIVIGGYIETVSDSDFAVYRLNTDGTLDPTFSGDGRASIGFGPGRQDYGEDLTLQADGKILVIGETCDNLGQHCDFGIIRLTSSGALDTSFSGDGRQRTDYGADETPYGVAVQSNGRIIVVGETYSGTTGSFALARYNANGNLDSTFGTLGKETFSMGSDSWAIDVLIQSNGKIVVAGAGHSSTSYDLALVRLNPNGSFDTGFSGDGKLLIDFGGHNDFGSALVRQPDGKYVIGGYVNPTASNTDFGLARVLP